MKTRGCWLIRLYSPDYFKGPTLESERGQAVIKLPLSLPYDGETLCDAAVERFQNGHEKKFASNTMKKEWVMGEGIHFLCQMYITGVQIIFIN